MNEQNEAPECDHLIRDHKLCSDIYTIMMLIGSGQDVDRILHEIVEESCTAFRCESAQIALREGEKWVIRYASHLPDALIGRTFTDEELPHAAITMATKKSFAIDDAFDDERTNSVLMKELGIRSMLVLPVMEKGSVIGTLCFGYHSTAVSLADTEIDYAEKVAAGVTIALQNVRLAQEAEESRKLGDALNAIDNLFYATHDYDAAMKEILQIATEAIGAETAMIFSRAGNRWEVSFVYNLSPSLIGRRFSNSSVLHTAITAVTRKSLVVADALNSKDVDPKFIEMFNIRSLLDFPLIVKGEVVGDLTFHYHTGAGLFKESHIEFVRKLQNSITLALENGRLLDAARQNEVRMKEAEKLGKFGYFHYDCRTGKITCSEGLFNLFGHDPALGEPTVAELFEMYSVEPGIEELKGVAGKDVGEFSAKVTRDGKVFHVFVVLQALKDSDGNVSELFGTIQDMTERKLAEEQLRQKEQMLIQQTRMAAVGEMLGNLAHHWRQPLNVLGFMAQELMLSYEFGTFSKELLDDNTARVMDIIKNLSRTIDDFRNFTLPDQEKSLFKVNEAVARAVSLIGDNFSEQGIAIEINTSGDPHVNGYPNEYTQVILNLLMNARDAFMERGAGNARILVQSWLEDGRAVMTISDNAGGIKKEVADHIFDAFFTTKVQGKGTGLGLFMSKIIIEKNMGGSLTVRNIEGGAEFRVEV